MMRRTSAWKPLTVCASALLLVACQQDMSDLRRYAEQIKSRPGGQIEPLPEIKTFATYAYPEQPGRDPFAELAFGRSEEDEDFAGEGSGPKPDATRPKEPLEAYQLDSLSYVGTLQRDNQRWALIRDPGGVIHRVQPGNHMGENYGRILSVSPSELTLRELVQTQRGRWTERMATLALND